MHLYGAPIVLHDTLGARGFLAVILRASYVSYLWDRPWLNKSGQRKKACRSWTISKFNKLQVKGLLKRLAWGFARFQFVLCAGKYASKWKLFPSTHRHNPHSLLLPPPPPPRHSPKSCETEKKMRGLWLVVGSDLISGQWHDTIAWSINWVFAWSEFRVQ